MSTGLYRLRTFLKSLLIIFFITVSVKLYAFEEVSFINEIRTGLVQPIDVAISPQQSIYVLDQKACKVFIYDATGYLTKEFGSCGEKEGEFNRPEAITLSPEKRILVADTGNNRIQAFDEDGRFLFTFGNSGQERGEFNRPVGLATNSQGTIYVADSYNNRVQIFSPHGIYRGYIPLASRPADLAVDGQNVLYVLLPMEGHVNIYTSGAEQTKSITCVDSGKNYLNKANAITIDHRGDIYITEFLEHSIKKFDKEQTLLLTFGSEGPSRGQFDNPYGISTDSKGNIYIIDRDNKRLQIFESTGSTKQALDTTGLSYPLRVDYSHSLPAEKSLVDIRLTNRGGVYVLSKDDSHLLIIDSNNKLIGKMGRHQGEFNAPKALDYGSNGNVYVADTNNNRVQVFDAEGNFIFEFGQKGQKNGQFSSPQGIVVNSKTMIYVADTLNNRIQIFNKDGIFLKAFGEVSKASRGEKPPHETFRSPTALAVDSNDNLYVVDQENNRIQIFDEHGKFLNSIGELGDGYQQFSNPVDIALTPSGILIVADQGNHRIQLINSELIPFPFSFGSPTEGLGHFQELTGVDVHGDQIYVTDALTNEIRVYELLKGLKSPEKPSQLSVVAQKQTLVEEIKESEDFELK